MFLLNIYRVAMVSEKSGKNKIFQEQGREKSVKFVFGEGIQKLSSFFAFR